MYLRKTLTLAMTAIIALTTVFPAAAADKEITSKDAYRIVALGDSISVGYEPGMTASSVPYGYVDRLYEQALFHGRSELVNYAIMGLTTPGLSNLLQGAADAKPLSSADLQDSFDDRVIKHADEIASKTSDIAADLATADLIVLTIGANDFGTILKAVRDQTTEDARLTIQSSFDSALNKYTADLDKMIRQLHGLAPNAQIVLADQYLPLFAGHALYPDLLAAVEKLSDQVDIFTEQLTKEGISVQAAHISDKSISNYFNAFDGFDTHPKQAGYEAIAIAFADVIWKQYLKPATRAADVPLSVIINGKELISKPTVVKNTTFLGLRDVSNAVGADLEWIQKKQTAIFRKNGREVSITIGAKTMIVNGITQPLDTPAYVKDKSIYVPLAVIIKGLDYQVVFRKSLLTAFINS